jgi:ectoine hydroxylase-related dioxygenase (phytanoyl-CoA dioxygenase family)
MSPNTHSSPPDLPFLVERLKMDGYVVLEDLLPLPLVDAMRERFDALLAERQAAQSSNRGPNRYQMYVPFEPPFADPALYENPAVLQILEALMGPDLICTYFASDTPLPGSEHQRVHVDTRLLFPETPLSLPAYGAVLNVPLVDVTEENGPLELWCGGTHLMPGRLDMAALAPGMASVRLKLNAGSALLRDLRVWHRGTPNRSARSRPHLALVYTRAWYRFEQPPFELSRAAFEALSDRAQAMFRFNRIVE